jgi:glycosidase
MLSLKRNALLYEVNTRSYLRAVNRKYGSTFTLDSIPDAEWDAIKNSGFDAVWLMGIWQHSEFARQEALHSPGLIKEYDRLLPGWTENDISASPYAVYSYSPDKEFGDAGELSRLKTKLNNRGLSLVLDFVPNHVAVDHPWVSDHPDWFIRGSGKDLATHPDWFFSNDEINYPAHGRDPNFPPWTDTAQLNYFSMDARQALTAELMKIARVSDAVRCDMAMLVLNDIFRTVWGSIVKEPMPPSEFWDEAIAAVKSKYPDFIFIAEAYWGKEKELLKLGFDHVYDKTMYDKLRYDSPRDIVKHIEEKETYIASLVHYIENHDEQRAYTFLGKEKSMAAAVVVATLPGIRMFFRGQRQGKKERVPIQLVSEVRDEGDADVVRFYNKLLGICRQDTFHTGTFSLLPVMEAWTGSPSHQNIMAWRWQHNEDLKVVAVNYSSHDSQARLKLPELPAGIPSVRSLDRLTDVTYQSSTEEVNRLGLYIALGPWQSHILEIKQDSV